MEKNLEENILNAIKSFFQKNPAAPKEPVTNTEPKPLTDEDLKGLEVVNGGGGRGPGLNYGNQVVFQNSDKPETWNDNSKTRGMVSAKSIAHMFKPNAVRLLKATLKEVVSLIVKEELSKAALEKQPNITVPVKLYLAPEQTTLRSAESVATLDDEEYFKLVTDYDAGNKLAGELVAKFANQIYRDRTALGMTAEDLKAFLRGKIEELKAINSDEASSSEERKKFAEDIVNEIKLQLEENLYGVPEFLTRSKTIEELIKNLEGEVF